MSKTNEIKDANERIIKVGDIILYGYGFWGAPVVGVVTKLNVNGFSYAYPDTKHDWITKIYSDCISTSMCKRTSSCMVINPCIKDKEFRKIFKIDMLSAYKLNDSFDDIANEITNETDDVLEQ